MLIAGVWHDRDLNPKSSYHGPIVLASELTLDPDHCFHVLIVID